MSVLGQKPVWGRFGFGPLLGAKWTLAAHSNFCRLPRRSPCKETFPLALFAADHRCSISLTACFMFERNRLAATSGVMDDVKKIRFRLPITGPPPWIGSAMALMPASDPPTEDA
jgi:hypothetical protein